MIKYLKEEKDNLPFCLKKYCLNQMMRFFSEIGRKHRLRRRESWKAAFLLFKQCFQKPLCSGSLKLEDIW